MDGAPVSDLFERRLNQKEKKEKKKKVALVGALSNYTDLGSFISSGRFQIWSGGASPVYFYRCKATILKILIVI